MNSYCHNKKQYFVKTLVLFRMTLNIGSREFMKMRYKFIKKVQAHSSAENAYGCHYESAALVLK